MNNLEFRVPKNEDEFNEYDLFRWRLLRKPIGKTIESLKDEYEDNSFHSFFPVLLLFISRQ